MKNLYLLQPERDTAAEEAHHYNKKLCKLFPPALGSYAAGSPLDLTVHVSVASVVPVLWICADLPQEK